MPPIKLGVHNMVFLHDLDHRPVWCHPIKPIHSGGSFTKDPKRTTFRCDLPLLLLACSEREASLPSPDFPRQTPTHIPPHPQVFSSMGVFRFF
ncbi:hypothetical protein AVEN_39992-1 [Araneus ventricosus]|uniref:Uncharacterized protein n=1 Tax=Araneus ventricosus TaxID=182803 RepID=A0A4Y2JYI7_ARAVE|nr:hypothetical protein AVEN_39992-1 [Araneus ventricosus]